MANSKIISYDLCGKNKNYSDLIEAIKEYRGWCKILESCWIVPVDVSCNDIRDNLSKYLDSDDRLFVGELTGASAWTNVICKNETLKERV